MKTRGWGYIGPGVAVVVAAVSFALYLLLWRPSYTEQGQPASFGAVWGDDKIAHIAPDTDAVGVCGTVIGGGKYHVHHGTIEKAHEAGCTMCPACGSRAERLFDNWMAPTPTDEQEGSEAH